MPSLPSRLSKDVEDAFTREGNTLRRAVKDYTPDKIELEIGDSKQAEFYPQAKIMRWDNEVNFSVRRQKAASQAGKLNRATPTVRTQGERVIFDDNEEEVHIYELPAGEIGEDGGLEIEIHLKEKPDTNRFDFSIETKGLNFFYQPEITDAEAEEARHGEDDIRTLEEIKREMRPENVVGSYAVYHKTRQNNRVGGMEYKTGKAFHIYRPHITDADGNETWGELHINEVKKELTVTVPQEFLDTAIYPVVVDPTFGYTSVGGSTGPSVAANMLLGTVFTAPENGIVSNLTAAVRSSFTTGVSRFKGVLVHYSSVTIISNGVGGIASADKYGDGPKWKNSAVASAPVSFGEDYLLSLVAERSMRIAEDSGPLQRYEDSANSFSTPVDPTLASPGFSSLLSIYATYTAAPPSEPPTVTTSAVTDITDTTATGNGNVTDDGGDTVTERGVVYSTSPNPTTADSKAQAASGGTGAFTASLTDLTADTTYYVRAYAINSEGTSYGSEVGFDTLSAASSNPQIKLSGTFGTKPVKIKLSGTFVEKPMKVKVSGSWV